MPLKLIDPTGVKHPLDYNPSDYAITIGRDPINSIVLPKDYDASSVFHATITVGLEEVCIEDGVQLWTTGSGTQVPFNAKTKAKETDFSGLISKVNSKNGTFISDTDETCKKVNSSMCVLNAGDFIVIPGKKVEDSLVFYALEVIEDYDMSDVRSAIRKYNTVELLTSDGGSAGVKDGFLNDLFAEAIAFMSENKPDRALYSDFLSAVKSFYEENAAEGFDLLLAMYNMDFKHNPSFAREMSQDFLTDLMQRKNI